MAMDKQITLPAALTSLTPLAHWLEKWLKSAPVSDAWRFSFDLAVCELASNVIRHALHEDARRCFEVRIDSYGDAVGITFIDSGAAFPPERLAAARGQSFSDDGLLAESGRGLALILHSVDSFTVERRGEWNISSLIKRFPSHAPG